MTNLLGKPSLKKPHSCERFSQTGGAQWANLGGQTLQLKWLVNCKDPMHDCNRFLWQILHTTGEHWTDISKCIYWMLNPRRWTHQITKYWRWTIRHLYWSAQPERHPVVKRQINLLHRLWHSIWHCWKWGNHKIQMQSNQMLDPKWMMQYVIKYKGCRQMALKAKKSDVTYFEKMIFHFWQKTFSVPACLLSCLSFGHLASLF